MAGRWRTWDIECLDVVTSRQDDTEMEPLIVPGWNEEISHIDFSSIVLPKEAFFTSSKGSTTTMRSKGRGRSLANRALAFDKPVRRPGERENSDKHNLTVRMPKEGSAIKFFGSEYLYEELFPKLDQLPATKTDLKPSIPAKTELSASQQRQKTEKGNQLLSDKTKLESNENSETNPKVISQEDHGKESVNVSPEKSAETEVFEQLVHEDDQSLNKQEHLQQNGPIEHENDKYPHECNSEKDKILGTELKDSQHSKEENFECAHIVENDKNTQEQQNTKDGLVDLFSNSAVEMVVVDKGKQVNMSDAKDGTALLTNSKLLATHQNCIVNHAEPEQNTNTICISDIKETECMEATQINDNENDLEQSLDSEPCCVLLENLPLALTEEELEDIVKPCGEMDSYNFGVHDDSSKICTIWMHDSMSGELLVVSLDGMEVDGYRIKAMMNGS